jgi:hypothetical protein
MTVAPSIETHLEIAIASSEVASRRRRYSGCQLAFLVFALLILTAPLLADHVVKKKGGITHGLQKRPRLEVQLTGKDFETWGTEKVIYSPEPLNLGWGRPLSAQSAVWKLASEPFPTRNIIATGTTTNPGGEWALFKLNLAGVIPDNPPASGADDYFIQVFPDGENLMATSMVKIVYKKDASQTNFTSQGIYPAGTRIIERRFTQTGDTWEQTDHPIGKNKRDWLCFLSKVAGTFAGHGERVRVHTDTQGNWIVTTRSSEPGMDVKATCVHVSLLGPAPSGQPQTGHFQVRWTDDESTLCASREQDVWLNEDNNRICFVNGMMGSYVSKDESIGIYGDKLILKECEDGEYAAYASCATTRFHRNTIKGIRTENNQVSLDLMPVSKGLCALSFIRGEFAEGSMVEIVRSGGWWKLIASAHQKNEHAVQVNAECWQWYSGN